jgi:hypothetical protein
MIGVGQDGLVAYANPAAAMMLGRDSGLMGCSLSSLLEGCSLTAPEGCLAALRNAGTDLVDWCHADGFTVHTVVSPPILLRTTDRFLLIAISDINDVPWSSHAPPMQPEPD